MTRFLTWNTTPSVRPQKTVGIFTIGGGVPRNWTASWPYLELIAKRVGQGGGFQRFTYGVRICRSRALGRTLWLYHSEGVSWGKFVPPSEGGRFAEVPSDATIAWPLIVKAVQERLAAQGRVLHKRLVSARRLAQKSRRCPGIQVYISGQEWTRSAVVPQTPTFRSPRP